MDEEEAKRKAAYEHVLRSIQSAYEILIEACWDIDDIGLDATRNRRDINQILNWVHEASAEIWKEVPELRPAPRDLPARRWPVDPEAAKPPDLSRRDALHRLKRNLKLAGLIIKEAVPFGARLGITFGTFDAQAGTLEDQLTRVERMHQATVQELWKDSTDEQKRTWIRDWGVPPDVAEPPPADKHAGLERLNEKLSAAAKLLDDCAGLVVELELGREHLSAAGSCLAAIFGVQEQIYKERPDLIPLFLRGSYELREQESQGGEKK